MEKYDHRKIEKKWQKYWEKNKIFKTKDAVQKPKYYVLDMFPYPSGAGLHVGHPKGYIATDVIARMKMMQGYNVLHPMGWDAFGLPTENYAIKNKIHPQEATEKNIKIFKKQLGLLGFAYDWEREINTTDPKYYQWTQWIFLQMFKRGLAYESFEPINWCPRCQTGLANEDLEEGKCERCGSLVERKPVRQWVLKITDYAERLLNDLKKLPDWPEPIKEMQRNWIGRSEGALVCFTVIASGAKQSHGIATSSRLDVGTPRDDILEVFTTRPDTLFGATYMVIAPEHPLISNIKYSILNISEVKKYIEKAQHKTDLERAELQKEKTGVELKGIKAVNPVNGEELPIFVADYVMMGYGTGAIMAVPSHDERDWEFAKKYGLPIKEVVAPLFKEIEGKDAIKNDKPTVHRRLIYAFVKHHKEEKYLCLDWEKWNWHSGIIGGVKEGEEIIEAAKREIQEETGYKNLRFIRKIAGEIHNNFFAAHKNENRYGVAQGLLFEIVNEEKEKPDEKHTINHKAVWVGKKEMENFLNLPPFRYLWDIIDSRKSECFSGDGINISSNFLDGLETPEAKKKMILWLEEKGFGKRQVQYKLRDWVFSRQRYWGEPIPLVSCEKCGWQPVPKKDLPLELPKVKHYEPTGTGESPLANIKEWVSTKCPKCGGPAKRETNTMPQWAGSCWYYLRYIDPKNNKVLIDENKEKYWNPVDLYVGGAEHATRHLIYARFWHKFLYDIGLVSREEPFIRLQNVGLILAEDGRKMSKRWNNVINPDDIVKKNGADAVRLYEMFMGPFDQAVKWDMNGLIGVRRFLERVWALQERVIARSDSDEAIPMKKGIASLPVVARNDKLTTLIHQTIKKVTEDIEGMKFNTAIAALMEFNNQLMSRRGVLSNGEPIEYHSLLSNKQLESFIKILFPFAPHLAEEIWELLGHKNSITYETWPEYDSELIKEETIALAVQVNGKLRDTFEAPADISEEEVKAKALSSEKIQKWLAGQKPKKVIYVKGKLVSIVI